MRKVANIQRPSQAHKRVFFLNVIAQNIYDIRRNKQSRQLYQQCLDFFICQKDFLKNEPAIRENLLFFFINLLSSRKKNKDIIQDESYIENFRKIIFSSLGFAKAPSTNHISNPGKTKALQDDPSTDLTV